MRSVMSGEYTSINNSRLTRRADRGSHNRQDVYDILDAAGNLSMVNAPLDVDALIREGMAR